jgi:hypothetical protein
MVLWPERNGESVVGGKTGEEWSNEGEMESESVAIGSVCLSVFLFRCRIFVVEEVPERSQRGPSQVPDVSRILYPRIQSQFEILMQSQHWVVD